MNDEETVDGLRLRNPIYSLMWQTLDKLAYSCHIYIYPGDDGLHRTHIQAHRWLL